MEPVVSIITVNYKQPGVTCEMLNSLRFLTYKNYEVIVVDNGSGDNSVEVISSLYPEARMVVSEKNLGFAGGNNLGIAHASGQYFLLVNNDTELVPGFIEEMLKVFQNDLKVGVVSPKIVYEEPNDLIQYAGALSINPYTGRGKRLGNYQKDIGQFDFIKETQLGHGAAFMVSREAVEKVGNMPELYFLYYEEHDWCEMIKKGGYKIMYNGMTKIIHKESISVGKSNPLKVFYMNRNRIIFIRRNCSSLVQTIISLLFYFVFAFPKAMVKYLLKGNFAFAKAMVKGAIEGVVYKNVHRNSFLNTASLKSIPA